MTMNASPALIILILLVILMLAGFPYRGTAWHGYGYAPSGVLFVVVVVLLLLILLGRL